MSEPFRKNTPSLFVISSPLQILCLVEAIQEFEISDFHVIYPFFEGEARDSQVVAMLDFYHIPFERVNIRALGNTKMIKDLFTTKKVQYERIFIGDYSDIRGKMIAYPYLKKGGCYVFLDDGIASIAQLKETTRYSLKDKVWHSAFNCFCAFRGNEVKQYFFTSYFDVKTRKTVFPNKFRHLIPQTVENEEPELEGLYFVGTNPAVFANVRNMTVVQYFRVFEQVLQALKLQYPDRKMYYIPHGRDKYQDTPALCEKFGYTFKKLDEAVELYFIKNRIYPEILCGFSSSALINVRKFMPKTEIINFHIDKENNPIAKISLDTSTYFSENGIEMRRIKVE